MSRIAFVLCASFIPFCASLADDDESQLLHNHPYQQSSSAQCLQVGPCEMSFPATEHVITEITGVSCGVGFSSSFTLADAIIGTLSDKAQYSLQPTYYGYDGAADFLHYAINGSSVHLFVNKGNRPHMVLFTVGQGQAISMICTISGYHS